MTPPSIDPRDRLIGAIERPGGCRRLLRHRFLPRHHLDGLSPLDGLNHGSYCARLFRIKGKPISYEGVGVRPIHLQAFTWPIYLPVLTDDRTTSRDLDQDAHLLVLIAHHTTFA